MCFSYAKLILATNFKIYLEFLLLTCGILATLANLLDVFARQVYDLEHPNDLLIAFNTSVEALLPAYKGDAS